MISLMCVGKAESPSEGARETGFVFEAGLKFSSEFSPLGSNSDSCFGVPLVSLAPRKMTKEDSWCDTGVPGGKLVSS